MGVYINMEMPPNCMLCNFCVPEADEANGEMCMVTGKLMPPCNHERLDNCPLVEVPPHGRLIDADKLCLSSGFSTATEYGMGRSDQIEAIKSNAPTVIPAEEGE